MKLTRRKFFAGLAIAPLVAVAVAKALPALADNMSLALARWAKTKPFTAFYTSLPAPTWCKLYLRLEPELSANWWETEEGKEAMYKTNEILAEMPWGEYDDQN